MNKSDLIQRLQQRYPHLPASEVELAVKGLIEQMAETLSMGCRIEIRGFGSFALRRRESGIRRNPRTGEPVAAAHYVPHFKPGRGQCSKQSLSDLVYGKQVWIEVATTDKYSRTVNKVWVNGHSMAGLPAPLSTLRAVPRGTPRMTRGERSSLCFRCDGLSPFNSLPISRRTSARFFTFRELIPTNPWLRPTPVR
jgi:integration host factor subunit beta